MNLDTKRSEEADGGKIVSRAPWRIRLLVDVVVVLLFMLGIAAVHSSLSLLQVVRFWSYLGINR